MRKIERLKKEALESTKFRGHDMNRFTKHHEGVWFSVCRNCPAGVTVRSSPMPNQIDIGGDAVALDCPVKER